MAVFMNDERVIRAAGAAAEEDEHSQRHAALEPPGCYGRQPEDGRTSSAEHDEKQENKEPRGVLDDAPGELEQEPERCF